MEGYELSSQQAWVQTQSAVYHWEIPVLICNKEATHITPQLFIAAGEEKVCGIHGSGQALR